MANGIPFLTTFGAQYDAMGGAGYEQLQASKGGKLLSPDEFYAHPARNIFGSYSTYVDWYAGGKARREQEKSQFEAARTGQWTPTDYGPVTPGTGKSIGVSGTGGTGLRRVTDMAGSTGLRTAGDGTRLGMGGDIRAYGSYEGQQRIPRLTEQAAAEQAAREAAGYKRAYEAEERDLLPPRERAKIDAAERTRLREQLDLAKEKEKRMSEQFKVGWDNRFKMLDEKRTAAVEMLGLKAEIDDAKLTRATDEAIRRYAVNKKMSNEYADAQWLKERETEAAKIADTKDVAVKKSLAALELRRIDAKYREDMKKVQTLREQRQEIPAQAAYEKAQAEMDAGYARVVEMTQAMQAPGVVSDMPTFATPEEAEAANLPIGTQILIGGRPAIVE